MYSDLIFNLQRRVADGSFLFLFKTLVFLFLPILNLGVQIRYSQNRYINLKSALGQPLTALEPFRMSGPHLFHWQFWRSVSLVLGLFVWLQIFWQLKLIELMRLFLTGIHSIQGWTATTRHRVTRKRSTKRLKHPGDLFRKNLQLIGVCWF